MRYSRGILAATVTAGALAFGVVAATPATAAVQPVPNHATVNATARPMTNYCGYYYGSAYVGYGYITSGDPVREVQCLLAGYGVVVDGIFGPKTQAAVLQLQAQFGLTVDGIVGPQTWDVLRNP